MMMTRLRMKEREREEKGNRKKDKREREKCKKRSIYSDVDDEATSIVFATFATIYTPIDNTYKNHVHTLSSSRMSE